VPASRLVDNVSSAGGRNSAAGVNSAAVRNAAC